MSNPTFTPVNRIGEPCACCARTLQRAVRGVRVDVDGGDRRGGLTFYYCDKCIGQLSKAKAHS